MIEELLARCVPADWLPGLVGSAGALGVPVLMLVAGLVGSVFHCAGMCGPFVLAQTSIGPAIERKRGALLLPYHLGRLLSYGGLGALAGATSGAFAGATGLRILSVAMLALGGMAFTLQGASGFGLSIGGASGEWSARWGRLVGRLAKPFMNGTSIPSGLALGLVLGLLPCGLLWGALAVAAGTGRASAGAAAMICFALGTVPALVAISWIGSTAGSRSQGAVARVAPVLLLANGATLFYFAWRASS